MPNIGFLFRGYDLMKGNPTPTSSDGVAKSDPGFQLPIFSATYSTLKQTSDNRYNIPDKVEAVSCTGCNLNYQSTTIESSQEYIDRLSLKVRASASGSYLGITAKFSASTDYEQLSHRINQERQVATTSEASCCVYEAELSAYDSPEYHPTFLEALSGLPEDYDVSKYRRFVQEYGTHYVKKATMGALYGQQSFITWEKRKELESEGLNINVQASVSAKIASGSVEVDVDLESEAHKKFESSTEQQAIYSHGANPPPNGDIDSWFRSVRDDPAPTSLEIERIDALDLPVGDSVKGNLETYLNSYCVDLVQEEVIGSCDVPGRPNIPNPTPSPTKRPELREERQCSVKVSGGNVVDVSYSKFFPECDSSDWYGRAGFVWSSTGNEVAHEYHIEFQSGNEILYESPEIWSPTERVSRNVANRDKYVVSYHCDNEHDNCYGSINYAIVDCGCAAGDIKEADCSYSNVNTAKSAKCRPRS